MTNTKAQVGDLVRIVKAQTSKGKYRDGGIYEVSGTWNNGVIIDVEPPFNDIYHTEYVIHRKAGEEDSPKCTRDLFREAQLQIVEGKTPEEAVAISMAEVKAEQDVPTTQADHIRKAGAELSDLLVRKNHDYGDSFAQQYAKYGLMSALIRMDDKIRRLETLLNSEEQAQVSESLSDTLLDLAGYALLAYVETQKK